MNLPDATPTPQVSSRLRRGAREFWIGLTQPSLAGLVGTLVIAPLLLLLACVTITPAHLARIDPGYLMAANGDEYGLLTARAMQLSQDRSGDATVLLLGTSNLRESLWDPRELADALSARAGRSVRVYDLTAGDLSYYEMTALAEQCPPGAPAIAVVTVGPMTMCRDRDHYRRFLRQPRLGLDSLLLDDEASRAGIALPRRFGVWFLDHSDFVSARVICLANFVTGPRRPLRHHFIGQPAWNPAMWDFYRRDARRWLSQYARLAPDSFASLEQHLGWLAAHRRMRIVLNFGPIQPLIRDDNPETFALFDAQLAAMAQRIGAPRWDLAEAAGLTADDFVDWFHLGRADAMKRYQAALADRLIPLLANIDKETKP
ncbi:MAG: hypothetical protein BIFFINMI_03502 [Phycisphaerae bacterium]|nr:hypothetical protein [Phycisphaerae bacterium]